MSGYSHAFYAYIFPRVVEDLCKIGFSRDPLIRLCQFHPRWFDFFDLDVGLLVGADNQREARDLELMLRRPLVAHRAPMPLTIRSSAGGKTEWMRGAAASLRGLVLDLAEQGYEVINLRNWLVQRLTNDGDTLYEWAQQAMESGCLGNGRAVPSTQVANVLEAYQALGIDLRRLLPEEVWRF